MKLRITVFIAVLLISASSVLPQDISGQIKIDTLKKYLRELTGVDPALIDGNTYTISSRNAASQYNSALAARYLQNRLQRYGLATYEQPFTFNGGYQTKNIYAVQQGTQYPDKKFIICAHYDAVSISPGADDNGSGTAAVLEAARIISKLSPKYTIVYALWSAEEQGLYGSKFYADLAYANGEDIVGVINMDMIAWDSDSDNNVEIYYYTPTGKESLMNALLTKLSDVNVNYELGMTITKIFRATANSDHYPFLSRLYPAFLMIEEMSDFNNYYHSSEDKYSHLYFGFYENCAKLAILSLAELSGAVTSPTSIEDNKGIPTGFALYQNYPNPFNPSTVITYNLKSAGHVRLTVFDAIGREIKTLVDEYKPAGKQQIVFSVEDKKLTSGIYFYKLQTNSLTEVKKMVYLR